jgi:hypothetical protein
MYTSLWAAQWCVTGGCLFASSPRHRRLLYSAHLPPRPARPAACGALHQHTHTHHTPTHTREPGCMRVGTRRVLVDARATSGVRVLDWC